ncbi:tryptophan synthase subunit alpha [Natrarchaeobaculum sulfurireducens]|uniref:Tryptophan synthase alpha chain n=1 Tax=Natrarchaeobaculum sulfurireducens TaxID=2044521 RepID=A0A346PG14_9EURY|nr:tryptophan synthase subunit alpha [Natrarchaeobaculum sulfurireducens]AXR78459.1 Tryptophan synthase alpha chain [Natrarchaeobaculum sulfurireducens]
MNSEDRRPAGGDPRNHRTGSDGQERAVRADGGTDSDIEATIRENDPALITYVTAGDPSLEDTKAYVEALDRGGADLIELGLPFSEPIAEGPTIQAAINRALEAGTTPDGFFDLVDDLETEAPLLVMTYYNMVLQYGPEADVRPFVERAAEVGLSGIIVPDLPAEEADPLRAACDEHGLDLVFIVAPTTEGERLETIMSQVSGFAYVQARLGTTGARGDVSTATHESLQRLADYDVPKAVGFGVSEGDHATEIVEAGADGVIVGSALIDIIADSDDTAEGVDRLEAKATELKAGAVRGTGDGRPDPDAPEPEHP